MKKTGIWIDSRQAIVVALEGEDDRMEKITSNIESQERYEGESEQSGRFGDQFVKDEKTKDHRYKHQVDAFVQKVMEHVRQADEIVVFGPAQMKTHLGKSMRNDHHFSSRLKDVEQADSMTDNQVKAWVRNYFAQPSS